MTVITKDQGKKTVFKYKMYTICPVYPRVQTSLQINRAYTSP